MSRTFLRQTQRLIQQAKRVFLCPVVGLLVSVSSGLVGAGLLFFVVSPTPGYIYGADDVYYFIYLPSVVIDGDLDFDNQLELYRRMRSDTVFTSVWTTADGRVINKYGIGYALLSLPFFLLGFPATFLARAWGIAWAYDGMNPLFQFSTTLASIAWGGIGIVVCQRILVRHFPYHTAWRAALLLCWATPLVFYLSKSASMAHATSFFTVALWMYVWEQRQADLPTRQALALGAVAALAFLVRYPNILVLLGVLVDLPRWWAHRPVGFTLRHWLRFWAWAAVAFCLCILPQLYIWYVQHGAVTVYPYPASEAFTHWAAPQFWQLFFADYRGLFNWHPVLLLAAGGLIVALRSQRWLAVHSLVILLGLCYLNASWYGVTNFGASFGNRVFVDALALFAVGMAAFLAPGRWQTVRWGLCLLLAGFNLGLVLATFPFSGPVPWGQRCIAVGEAMCKIAARLLSLST